MSSFRPWTLDELEVILGEEPKRLMAKAFDVMTCPDNHPVYLLVSKVYAGDMFNSGKFVPLNGSKTPAGYATTGEYVCPICKKEIFNRFNSDGVAIYIRGELRGNGNYIEEPKK